MFYIYILIDPFSDKIFYIGKGKDRRLKKHEEAVKRGDLPNKTNTKLFNKIKKILNSGGQIVYKKVFFTTDEMLCYKIEEKLIREYGLENLCNLSEGGGRILRRGYTQSKDWIINRITSRKRNNNYAVSSKTRRKMSKAKIGKALSKNHKLNISKSVLQINTETGKTIKEWDSIIVAGLTLNINYGNICQVCKGKRKTANGYNWKYKEKHKKRKQTTCQIT